MGDELASFFAKKKAKGSKKKAIRLDDVGQQLEYNQKLENEVNEEENPTIEQVNNFSEEDSEWIEYGTKNLKLAGETVGTFNFNDQLEEEVISDDSDKESTPVEKTKTWGAPAKEQPPAKETVISAVTTTQSKFEAYKPPTQRSSQQAQVKKQKVDLHSEEMFPSLGDADKIEKLQTDEQKKQKEEKAATPPVETAPSRPEPVKQIIPPVPRPAAPKQALPSGSAGYQNAKGEWIILDEPKSEPKVESKPEVTPWRRSQAPTETDKPEVTPWRRAQPPVDGEKPARPTPTVPRTAPPTGSQGYQNAKGEWIVLEEPKEEPKVESKPEILSWRRQGPPATDKSAPPPPRQSGPKTNPFGAARPVNTKLPPTVKDNDEGKWVRKGGPRNTNRPTENRPPPPAAVTTQDEEGWIQNTRKGRN